MNVLGDGKVDLVDYVGSDRDWETPQEFLLIKNQNRPRS